MIKKLSHSVGEVFMNQKNEFDTKIRASVPGLQFLHY